LQVFYQRTTFLHKQDMLYVRFLEKNVVSFPHVLQYDEEFAQYIQYQKIHFVLEPKLIIQVDS